ncbi:retron Ec78 anti-phage system effector HNH endonuclease PtuB [Vibrio lentus]|uniref:retron Ec78 anti-phage system effector HNH endonuclease PtuB n=1 Tax=Vibrio lentus TaxID=136468 RepID=UPI003D0EB6D6
MKKLVRGNAPVCLARFKHGQDNWTVIFQNNLTNDIWEKLSDMQHGYCAYCECKLTEDNSKRHIEHFIQKSLDPTLTFSWDNLFGSCNNPNRCGKYKDESPVAKQVDLSKVCKPDIRDPGELLIYLNSGKVRAKTGLDVLGNEIANNTITVFNLDGDSTLENSRRAAIAGEKSLAAAYWEMLVTDDTGELAELLELELTEAFTRIEQMEHSTALAHLWVYNEGF